MKRMKKPLSVLLTVGIIDGTTDARGGVILDPQGSATRGQIAAIIERFCEKVVL